MAKNITNTDITSILHIANQIAVLREWSSIRICKGIVPPSNVLDVIADSMESVALLLDERLYTEEWKQIYQDIRKANLINDFEEKLLLWERIVKKSISEKNTKEWRSAEYWENRYVAGGTSGAGSYNRLAAFKAMVINEFVSENDIRSVVEWGCGDGNQLKYANYPSYIGFDVSNKAVKLCQEIFEGDDTKEFFWCGADNFTTNVKCDLALSLDVLYHLIEDNVFELYMKRLFASSNRYVCIYSCNYDKVIAQHVKCRRFTDYVERNMKDWELIKIIPNAYPYNPLDPDNTSWSDFYIYEKNN